MVQLLGDSLDGNLLGLHLQLDRIIHERPCKIAYLGTQGGREEHGLPFGTVSEQTEHLLDVGIEPHVEQAVRLINDEDVKLTEINLVHFLVVEDTTRGADKNITPLFQDLILLAVAYAAKKTPHRYIFHGRGEFKGILLDLHGKFSGRGYNEGLRLAFALLLGFYE